MITVSRMLKLPAALAVAVLVSMSVDAARAADGSRSGTFQGRSNHVTTGTVTVTRTGGRATLTLASNFSLDGAPDPWIGFGKSGRYLKATQFSKLRRLRGRQTYRLPASIDLDAVNEVYMWCSRFAVPLGVARIR